MNGFSNALAAATPQLMTIAAKAGDNRGLALNGADLGSVLGLLTGAATILGGILLLWGAIGIGLAIKDGQGMSMDTNVGKVVGGALIVVSAQAFNTITA